MQYISLGIPEYFSIGSGVSVPIKEEAYWGNEVAYVVPADFAGMTGVAYISETKRILSEIGVEKAKNRISPIGTILILRSSPGYRIPRIGILKVPAVVSHHFLAVTVNDEKLLLPDYVAIMLDLAKDQIAHFTVGDASKFLRRETLLSMPVPLVSIKEQKAIVTDS